MRQAPFLLLVSGRFSKVKSLAEITQLQRVGQGEGENRTFFLKAAFSELKSEQSLLI